MTNKRMLKKQIRLVCGDLAAESIMALHIIPNADSQKLSDCVVKIAELQTQALNRASVSFDKTPREFANKAEYNKARKAYYSAAFKSLVQHFNKQVEEILHEMNLAMPKR